MERSRLISTVIVLGWVLGAGVERLDAQQPPRRLPVHEAVRLGLQSHPRVAQAHALERAAGRGLGEATALRIPTLAVEGSATRFAEPMVVAPLHAFDPTRPPGFATTLIQSRWTAQHTVFDGGIRRSRIGRARADVAGAAAGADEAEMAVIELVVTAYLRALTAHEIDEAQTQRLAALDAELDRVGRVFAEGRAARVDVLRVEAELARATAERIRASRDLATSLAELTRVLGLDTGLTRGDLVEPLPVALPDPGADAADQAVRTSAEVRRARSQLTAERAVLSGARAEWLPAVRLVGGVNTFGGGGADFSGEWQVGVGISYPLFTGGARAHRIARAAARAEAAAEHTRVVELSVRSRVDRALSDVQESAAQIDAWRLAVDHLTEVVRIERLAVDAGAGVVTDYLRAEADLIDARAALVRARHAQIVAHIVLAHATGALSPEWLARHLESQP